MKKRLWFFTIFLLFLLGIGSIWYFRPCSYKDLPTYTVWNEYSIQPAHYIYTIAGGVPDPEATESYQAIYALFKNQRFRRCIPGFSYLFPISDGGTLISIDVGCTAHQAAYWSKGILWMQADNQEWIPYVPKNKSYFDEQMETLANKYSKP